MYSPTSCITTLKLMYMKQKITTFLLFLFPSCLLTAQSSMMVNEQMSINNGGSLTSQGTITLNASASQGKGIIVNKGTLNITKGLILRSDDDNDGLLANTAIVNTTGVSSSDVQLRKTFADGTKYYYVSFPFSVKMSDIKSAADGNPSLIYDHDYYMMEYDAASRAQSGIADSWKDVVAGSTLVAGKGYLFALDEGMVNREVIFPASDITNLFSTVTTNKTINLSYDTYTGSYTTSKSWGWNFVGGLTTSNYTMSQSNLGYSGFLYYYNKTTRDYEEIATSLGQSTTMPPYISFFTHEVQAGKTLGYSVTGVTTNAQNSNLRSEEQQEFDIISLWINGKEYNDRLRIVTGDSYPENLDYHKDAPKLFSPDKETPQLWSMLEGDELCINMLPKKEYRSITLGVKTGEAGEYTISMNPDYSGYYQSVVLLDKETNLRTSLLTNVYSFSAGEFNTTDRFLLELSRMPTSIDKAETENVIIYTSHHQLFVKNISAGDQIKVYDVAGRLLISAVSTDSDFVTSLNNQEGALIVKVNGSVNNVVKVTNY